MALNVGDLVNNGKIGRFFVKVHLGSMSSDFTSHAANDELRFKPHQVEDKPPTGGLFYFQAEMIFVGMIFLASTKSGKPMVVCLLGRS